MRSSRDHDLDALADVALAAQAGDRGALARLSREIQQPVYRLALRFCGHPVDAEDAALEVMLRLLTTLETYDRRSRFTTWVYASAVRQLLRSEARPAEAAAHDGAERPGSLLFLTRDERVAYVLTDLLGFTVGDGADICVLDEETFQDQLIVARSKLRQRRTGVGRPAGPAETVENDAPETVWSRLVATMPSHLGAD